MEFVASWFGLCKLDFRSTRIEQAGRLVTASTLNSSRRCVTSSAIGSNADAGPALNHFPKPSSLLVSVSALFFFDIPLCIALCFELFSITLRIVFSFTSLIQHYSSPASTRYVRPHPHAASSFPIDGVSSQPLHSPASSGS